MRHEGRHAPIIGALFASEIKVNRFKMAHAIMARDADHLCAQEGTGDFRRDLIISIKIQLGGNGWPHDESARTLIVIATESDEVGGDLIKRFVVCYRIVKI